MVKSEPTLAFILLFQSAHLSMLYRIRKSAGLHEFCEIVGFPA